MARCTHTNTVAVRSQIDGKVLDVRFSDLAARSFENQQNVDRQRATVDQFKAAIVADEGAIEAAQTQHDLATITARGVPIS